MGTKFRDYLRESRAADSPDGAALRKVFPRTSPLASSTSMPVWRAASPSVNSPTWPASLRRTSAGSSAARPIRLRPPFSDWPEPSIDAWHWWNRERGPRPRPRWIRQLPRMAVLRSVGSDAGDRDGPATRRSGSVIRRPLNLQPAALATMHECLGAIPDIHLRVESPQQPEHRSFRVSRPLRELAHGGTTGKLT